MILMLILFVILVCWLADSNGRINSAVEGNPSWATVTPAAIDILKERYARGEIDRATYQAMRKEVA